MGEAARSVFSASIALLAGYAFIRVSYYRRFSAEHLKTDRFALFDDNLYKAFQEQTPSPGGSTTCPVS
jgi:hypothetical protein